MVTTSDASAGTSTAAVAAEALRPKRSAKARRSRSPHPGVVLLKPDPDGRHPSWRARYVDPDTRRPIKVTLEAAVARTADTRRVWAMRKSKALGKRRVELEDGAPRTTGTTLQDAIKRYFEDNTALQPRTLASYRGAADKLVRWAESEGIRSADSVTRAALLGFRGSIINAPKQKIRVGGRRGEREATEQPRGAHAVNKDLRSIRVVLGYLADLDLLPKVREGDLRRATKRVRVATEAPAFLTPRELQRLLQAALRHDAETYVETREEHVKSGRPSGTTPRYSPIAPFVAGVLLTGARVSEALALDWKMVDVEALDETGSAVGEINLPATITKTHRARTIGLEVSPALRALLAALKLRSGGKGSVFGLTLGEANAAAKRLVGAYGAPESFTWQVLRSSCETYLVNAPAVLGSAGAYRAAKQLGHSVTVAERYYAGLLRGISPEANALEAAMQVEAELKIIIARVQRTTPARRRAG